MLLPYSGFRNLFLLKFSRFHISGIPVFAEWVHFIPIGWVIPKFVIYKWGRSFVQKGRNFWENKHQEFGGNKSKNSERKCGISFFSFHKVQSGYCWPLIKSSVHLSEFEIVYINECFPFPIFESYEAVLKHRELVVDWSQISNGAVRNEVP